MTQKQYRWRRQIAARVEAAEGVLESLTSADVTTRITAGSTYEIMPAAEERDLGRESTSSAPDLVGGSMVRLRFGVELCPHQSGLASEPPISKYLRACGLRRAELRSVTIGAVTGTFRHGELITAAGGKVGVVVTDVANGTTTLRYELISTADFAPADVITGSVSAATATASAAQGANQGRAWWPSSFATYRLTMTSTQTAKPVGTELVGGTSGARAVVVGHPVTDTPDSPFIDVRMLTKTLFTNGETINDTAAAPVGVLNTGAPYSAPSLSIGLAADRRLILGRGMRGTCSLPFVANRKVLVAFEMQGILQSAGDGDLYSENPPYVARPPEIYRGGTALVAGVSVPLSSFDLTVAKQIEMRGDPTDASGYEAAQDVMMKPTLSFDPDALDAQVFDALGVLQSGARFAVRAVLGTAAPGRFELSIMNAQLRQHTDSERQGVASDQLVAHCSAGNYGSQAVTLGMDNAFILLQY